MGCSFYCMKYFTSQQDSTYFHWQIETYLRNFESRGIDLRDCHVILLYKDKVSDKARELSENYDAHFHFYPIDKECYNYIASVKPYGMWQFYKENPKFSERIFYHDADIIFTSLPIFPSGGNFMSATLQLGGMSYVDLEYLNLFEGVVSGLEEIVGVKARKEGGGAQYIFNPSLMTPDYWEKVYRDSFAIYDFLGRWNLRREKGSRDVQQWCAEMWATLWNVWYFGEDIQIHESLDMCMSRDPISALKPIVHNAGLMAINNFDKGRYSHRYPPYGLKVAQDLCNAIYYKEVEKIHYIRYKHQPMGKIKIIKVGSQFQLGAIVDLGEERNVNAINTGFAEWVEEEVKPTVKKVATAKKTTTPAKTRKK